MLRFSRVLSLSSRAASALKNGSRLFAPLVACGRPILSTSTSRRLFSSEEEAVDETEAMRTAPREVMEYDVVIVGAGPAGLGAAIRLKQLCAESKKELSVCVIEKGAEVGAHVLSGNVFEPRALKELFPDFKERQAPLDTPAGDDRFYFLTETGGFQLPSIALPPMLHNHGNYIISLGLLCRWLAKQAEELGVEIYPGFAAAEILEENGGVVGVATRDVGIAKDNSLKPTFARGMELRAKQTVFAEGVRGSLSEMLMKKYNLREGKDPQVYGIGIKEVWELDPKNFKAGSIQHSLGWPIGTEVYGGSFMYHMNPNLLLVGFVVGLDYKNPYLSPYEEFQRFKTHPLIRPVFEGAKPIAYGARCINEGGFQSIPKLTFPGGVLVGCSAGYVNVPKVKGSHTALKSGMVAGESLFTLLTDEKVYASKTPVEAKLYQTAMEKSWVWEEMKSVRNVKPAFHHGFLAGLIQSGISCFIAKGMEPYTLHNAMTDSESTSPAANHPVIKYPKPDNKLTFDILVNLARSGTNHEGDQPAHLRIKPNMENVAEQISYPQYAGPEQRFCPAKVYEYIHDEATDQYKLNINAQNCLHCKTCDIKMPREYVQWTVPEGGGGPSYEVM